MITCVLSTSPSGCDVDRVLERQGEGRKLHVGRESDAAGLS